MKVPSNASGLLGKEEFMRALRNLPQRVVLNIMADWTRAQAKDAKQAAIIAAPRDKKTPRQKAESARLWRSLKASAVRQAAARRQGQFARAITYSAADRGRRISVTSQNVPVPKARHFHLTILGTGPRYTKKGAYRGIMPKSNWFSVVATTTIARSTADVNRGLRISYERGIQREINRLRKRFT